jgi:serine/threonine protein phosphatase PrpC
MVESRAACPILEWGWAGAALDGATDSGDLHVVIPLPRGALLAVIDGLGHGPEAAEAAREAARVLELRPALPLRDLLELCHEELRRTRGVVMSLMSLDAQSSSMDWFGVGNVEGVLLRATSDHRRIQEAIMARGGVLGYRLPPVKITTTPLLRGDLLVLATDGLRNDFSGEVPLDWEPQAIADWLLQRFSRGTDDSRVLVARYLGGKP